MPPVRPWKDTGFAPFTASLTSSTIWPALISNTTNAFAVFASSASGSLGNGHSEIGRNSPTFTPLARALLIAVIAIRDVIP